MTHATGAGTSRRRRTRALFHLTLFAAFAAAGGALLVWPQWLEADGARSALEIQQDRERVLIERLNVVRSMRDRLRHWDRTGRRVLLESEVAQFPQVLRTVAEREGLEVLRAAVTDEPSLRWRPLLLQPADWEGEDAPSGEIQPRLVRLVVSGTFDGIYRAVATLGDQPQLFLPERWDLARRPGSPAEAPLRAELWATVFVVKEPETAPPAPVTSGSRLTRLSRRSPEPGP